eukprot:1146663-Pelagomonas_calceolata.AAC.2
MEEMCLQGVVGRMHSPRIVQLGDALYFHPAPTFPLGRRFLLSASVATMSIPAKLTFRCSMPSHRTTGNTRCNGFDKNVVTGQTLWDYAPGRSAPKKAAPEN